jgi:hypothetical protein
MEAIAREPNTTMDWLTIQEFQRGMSRKKDHYADYKDEKDFFKWNTCLAAIAHMHYTDNFLDETYVPILKTDIDVFKEIQAFMYDVLNLKTDKGKLMVSQFRSTLDVQGIFRELKKHALSLLKRSC